MGPFTNIRTELHCGHLIFHVDNIDRKKPDPLVETYTERVATQNMCP
jgi:hypothetical protein